ncbi:hypothetical protein C7M84_019131 [Penaeus vannamei]|uniref:Uncharacterized protein n=1 Tax=Penaeus vannamei TaxID=6689 RepID=A0A3R7Q3P2_PENVA|nr:hypothetical protein C7M84_019131 [Penaeus vannamei]
MEATEKEERISEKDKEKANHGGQMHARVRACEIRARGKVALRFGLLFPLRLPFDPPPRSRFSSSTSFTLPLLLSLIFFLNLRPSFFLIPPYHYAPHRSTSLHSCLRYSSLFFLAPPLPLPLPLLPLPFSPHSLSPSPPSAFSFPRRHNNEKHVAAAARGPQTHAFHPFCSVSSLFSLVFSSLVSSSLLSLLSLVLSRLLSLPFILPCLLSLPFILFRLLSLPFILFRLLSLPFILFRLLSLLIILSRLLSLPSHPILSFLFSVSFISSFFSSYHPISSSLSSFHPISSSLSSLSYYLAFSFFLSSYLYSLPSSHLLFSLFPTILSRLLSSYHPISSSLPSYHPLSSFFSSNRPTSRLFSPPPILSLHLLSSRLIFSQLNPAYACNDTDDHSPNRRSAVTPIIFLSSLFAESPPSQP